MRGRSLRTAGVLLLVPCVVLVGLCASAQEPPKQSWDDLAHYPAQGLSPLYHTAGERCREILSGNEQWAVLPRPINGVLASPDETPCFEMHNGDTYYNDYLGNAEAIRWAAEQSWHGAFRLFYNTTTLARRGDEFWLTIDGFRRPLKFLSGSDWTSYLPLGSRGLTARTCYLARHAAGGWWIASQEGLYRLLGLRSDPPTTRFLAAQLATSHDFNITRAREDLGYQPQVSMAEGMERLAGDLARQNRP